MLALRYICGQDQVTVVRLHRTYTQARVQRVIDEALAADVPCQFWSAEETLFEVRPAECTLVQVLELQRG